MQPDLALFTVDQIDRPRRQIVFALADGQMVDVKAAKALAGTGVFRVGSDLPIGRVVDVRKSAGRAFVTVKFSDTGSWNKAKHGVFRAAQSKVYDGKLGSLNVVDAPFDDPTVLHKAARAEPETSASEALVKALRSAGWRGHLSDASPPAGADAAKRLADAVAHAKAASAMDPLALAERGLTTDELIKRSIAQTDAMIREAFSPVGLAKRGYLIGADGGLVTFAEAERQDFMKAWADARGGDYVPGRRPAGFHMKELSSADRAAITKLNPYGRLQ